MSYKAISTKELRELGWRSSGSVRNMMVGVRLENEPGQRVFLEIVGLLVQHSRIRGGVPIKEGGC